MARRHFCRFCRGTDRGSSIGLIKRKFAQPFVQPWQFTVIGHVDAGHAIADRIGAIFHFGEEGSLAQSYRGSADRKFVIEKIIPPQAHEGSLLHPKSGIVLKLNIDGQSGAFNSTVDDSQGT